MIMYIPTDRIGLLVATLVLDFKGEGCDLWRISYLTFDGVRPDDDGAAPGEGLGDGSTGSKVKRVCRFLRALRSMFLGMVLFVARCELRRKEEILGALN